MAVIILLFLRPEAPFWLVGLILSVDWSIKSFYNYYKYHEGAHLSHRFSRVSSN